MSIGVTLNHPRDLTVSPEHVSADGRVMVHVDDEDNFCGLLLWMKPEVAAQWIEALTPLAEGKP
jgi:hypothetical protein